MTQRMTPSMNQPEWHSVLDTPTGPDALDKIHRCLDELWSAHPELSEVVRTQLSVAVAEIGANIIEYSHPGQPMRIQVRMQMQVHLLAHEVEIVFTDEGDPAHVDLATVTMPDEMAERGRGLALAKACLDRLTYRRDATGNHWTLAVKR
jgi:serine/threonine-protein kinase RsbW